MVTSPHVAVVGAGCSGITALKNLLQAGVSEVVCFEQNDQVGGNWIYTASESHSSVCETTHIISSKKLSEYMDFPMPDHYPDYPSHQQVLAYFQSYAEHFGLLPYIRFNTRIEQAEKIAGERWQLTLADGQTETFDYLFIANGHHNTPRHPEDVQAAFTGRYLHAHQYKTNQPFAGERVLVIGAGNSGCDCAVEISRVADHVAISVRRPQYIIPKFFLGRPTDTFNEKMLWIPERIANWLRRLTLRIQVGSYRDYGLEDPDFPVTKGHPTLNSELLYKIRHGKVHPRRGIAQIKGQTVRFTDGREEIFDTIVAATGYKIALPFFARDFINYEEADRVPLYLRMFHADHPTLAFIGLFQPQGAIWPLSDYQGKLAANWVMGRWQLPDNLAELAEKDSDYIDREFLASKRHTIEVHYHGYLRQLQRAIPTSAPDWKAPVAKQTLEQA
jgi:hypothetical protein